ncbi:phosphatase PAP2 family protein [Weeksellaceae bacterium TAE3-ERU29]|nr:phosphatase PAP2 family protein [Weeksellaceae bacterium TAE3-ERU29]
MQIKTPKYWYSLGLYLLLTLIVSIFFAKENFNWSELIINRVVFGVLLFIAIILRKKISVKIFQFVSLLMTYSFLSSVYKETATLNTLFFNKQDDFLIHIDNLIFSFQPSLEFSKTIHHWLFSELMFLGYFSYYLMPLFVMFKLYNTSLLKHFGFILITSFTVYYTIFILFPVEGPQFHFSAPDNYIEAKGIFGYAVKLIQAMGEAPTAAFPSSHVGISVVVLLWLYQYQKNLIKYILPFSILLFFATVYIKAHYAIDAIAGLLSGIIIYKIVNSIYLLIQRKSYAD